MLRWMMPCLVATFAFTAAAEAVGPAGKAAARRAASQLPAGLPRAHYKFRTTIAPAAPAPYARRFYVGEPEVPFTPTYGYVSYVPPAVGVAWLPGYPAGPGNWGPPFDHDYQSPWYGGAEFGTWNGLPAGCGGYNTDYGYC